MYTRCREFREGGNRQKKPPEKTVVSVLCSGMTETEQGDVAGGEKFYTSCYIQKKWKTAAPKATANTQRLRSDRDRI